MPLIFFFHERFEPVLVLQIRGLVVQGPLELGFTLFVGSGAGTSFLRLPQVEVTERTPSCAHVLVESYVVTCRKLARLGVK